jgi:hypothetical protein
MLYGFTRRFGGAMKSLRRRLAAVRLEPTGGL